MDKTFEVTKPPSTQETAQTKTVLPYDYIKLIGLLLFMTGCGNDPKKTAQDPLGECKNTDALGSSILAEATNTNGSPRSPNPEPIIISGSVENLPEWGIVNFDYNKYYPGILDTVKDRGITTANRLKMNPGNGIMVTILKNHGTFDQMFLCTHDSNSTLLDTYYIGMATMYDKGKARNIEKTIVDSNTLTFTFTVMADRRASSSWTMDTTQHAITTVKISDRGIINTSVKTLSP